MMGRPPLALGATEVEVVQPRNGFALTTGDGVEFILHPGGEVIVDEIREVVLEQMDHRDGGESRNQGLTLVPDIAAILDRLDDGGVGRWSADAARLEFLDQSRLGVSRRRLSGVIGGIDPFDTGVLPGGEPRQDFLLIGDLGARIVGTLDIGAEKAGEVDDLARGSEDRSAVIPGRCGRILTLVRTPRASRICEARVRFQINS